jgi:hypothetical protein
MHTLQRFRRTASMLLATGALGIAATATAQTAPPEQAAPPPGYNQPPPGYNQPPPADNQQPPPGYYQQPPPGYQQQPPPGYYPPPVAYAPPPPQTHKGFFLRLHAGAGYGHMGGTDSFGDEVAFVGGGGTFGIAAGGTVAPNFVIFGNLFGMFLSDPNYEFNGVPQNGTSGTTTIGGIGPGAAYFFQPINLYISATIAATFFQAQDADGTNVYESDTGYGAQLMVGKEWWISQNWGIGLAGELIQAGGMKDKFDPTIKWGGTAFSLVFSATCN